MGGECAAVIVISAEAEWRVRTHFPEATPGRTPFGEWFAATLGDDRGAAVVFMHGGWGKIAAAASAQHAIDRWGPRLLVNLGTCGGFAGRIGRGQIVLARRTVVYDLSDRMGDTADVIAWYATDLDLAWLGDRHPQPVRVGVLASGDADLDPLGVADLHERYGAIAGDWESGAIAYVAARNGVRCLILRGVSDLVGGGGGEAYDGKLHVFVAGAETVMATLLPALPAWLALAR